MAPAPLDPFRRKLDHERAQPAHRGNRISAQPAHSARGSHPVTRLLSPCLLVAGAHDPLGRRVVELLLRRDEAEVIATSRQPVHLVDLAARGARIRGADPDDAASLDAAFTGAHRLLLLPGAADGSWSRRRQLQAMIDAAARVGVRTVVYAAQIEVFDPSLMTVARECETVAQY